MSPKQQIFVNEYLKCWNATEAARRAEYRGNGNTLAVNASRLLRNDKVAAAIQARLAESAMSADEALMRLGQMARADLGDFGEVWHRDDLAKHPLSHLVKKLTVTTSEIGGRVVTRGEGAEAVTTEIRGKLTHKLQLELYDAQKAVVDILKEHGRFVQEVKHSGTLENKLIILPAKDDD